MSTNRTSYIFSIIKQALRGEEHDYTAGSLRLAIFMLAVPMILEMCMESIFAVVDIFFVGRIGKEAISTVVLTESFLTILYSAAIAFSVGATAIVARRVGEKNFDGAAHAGAQAINLGLMVAAVVSFLGIFFAKDVLQLMGASDRVLAIGVSYTRIVFGSSVVILLLFLINGVFRGAGNASVAMKSLWVANGFNIILCPLMIHFFGLTGAAIATATGRGLGVCYQLYHLFRGKHLVRVRWEHFGIDWPLIRSIFSISWVGFVQFFIASASWIVMARIISSFQNDSAIAGYGLAIRIVMFFILPAWGMSNAAATLVGQNLGAKQPRRAETAVKLTAIYNALFMAVVTLLFMFAAEAIVGFMNKDKAVEQYAVQALRVISAGYIFYGIGMVLTSSFNGAGDTKTPTLINLVGFWAFQIPLAFTLAKVLNWGPLGVFIAIPVAETLITLIAYFLFRRGRWKTVKV